MKEHDPRCEVPDDQKVLDDVAEYGWHVMNVWDQEDSPGWAYSIGLFKSFSHPEVVVFGLPSELMHSIINSIGDEVRCGKTFAVDGLYPDLIEAYACTFKDVSRVWYQPFLGYANWFYKGLDYPIQQCVWPDKSGLYPWESKFNPNWLWAQPLLFHEDPASALMERLLESLES